ncbi:hypothetical protein [Litchfieldella rifensis]|uniref:Sulfotransferase domain-containing protein n=1 Tax=Litchfieldella rifensis TaxID=762643 RepID=A0ABV7LTP5_9GAMM
MSNGQAITVVATKRSGHHAFIEWICNNLDSSYLYLNNLPLRKDEVQVKFLEAREEGKGGEIDSHRYKEHKLISSEKVERYDNVILSYENQPLRSVLSSNAFMAEQELLLKSERTRRLIVFIRDPVNAFASFLKVVEKKPEKIKQFAGQKRAWMEHARLFLGESSRDVQDIFGAEVYMVSYNQFIRSADYRQTLAKELGLSGAEWSRSLSRFGGGGNTFFQDRDGYQASVDSLESRWEELEDKSLLSEVFRDDSLYDLSLRFYQEVGLEHPFASVMGSLRAAKEA